MSAPRLLEKQLVLAQAVVRAVSAPWREVARAENDPVIVLEVAECQNRQAERILSRPPSTIFPLPWMPFLVIELLSPGSFFGYPEIKRVYN